jgi:protein SCO1
MVFTIFACLLLIEGTAQHPSSRLAVISPAPGFTLTDQNGKPATLSESKGKVLLVSFVFTTCNGTCPATTHRMAAVQQELKRTGLWNTSNVQFLAITLDPERDTPEVLRKYMKLYDLDGAGWQFLSGPQETLAKTIAAWGMWAKAAANGQIDHPSRIFLVDRRQQIREIYNIELLTVSNVCDDIALLMHEEER